MLLKIRKSKAIHFKSNDTPKGRLINLSSHLYINLHQVTELSHYTLKQTQEMRTLDGTSQVVLESGTKVLHFTLVPTFASYPDKQDPQRRIHERRFYTVYFTPEAQQDYAVVRQVLNGQVFNNDD
ncbi:hypothetical protein V6U78_12020 [Marinospirillum sp. MEB164]|uniref:Uncharacterized protein n=1 Tax=Marinospirillum alkalitolerans TaxID=3123374 RepID=A0ABW8Q131_9GAMM